MNQRNFPALTSLRHTAHVAGVLSHKFVKEVFVMQAAPLQPRQGRKIVAQGVRSCEIIPRGPVLHSVSC